MTSCLLYLNYYMCTTVNHSATLTILFLDCQSLKSLETSWIIEYFDIMCWTQLCLVNIKWRAVRNMWFGRTKRLFHFLPRFLLATLIDSMRLNLRHVHRSSSDQVWVRERTCVLLHNNIYKGERKNTEEIGTCMHTNQDSRVE